jgi:hydroxymethylglutaryl-CoA reductase (NADPH)
MLIKCFDVELHDLRDALFVFVFLLDIGRASLLAQYSLLAKSHKEIHTQIGKGMGILGPELTLDTIVEVLVIGIGTLSGKFVIYF